MVRKVTMADVAKQLGLSKTSVSLALSGRPGVSENTRQMVREAADRMGYQGKTMQSISRTRPRTVVFLHQEYRAHQGITGIRLGYVAGMQAAADAFSLQVVIDSLNNGRSSGLSLDLLRTRPTSVLGVFLVGLKGPEDPTLTEVRQLGLPFVIINRYWPTLDVSFVSVDFPRAQAEAVQYLYGMGHRRIAFAGLHADMQYCWYRQRLEGYHTGLAAVGCPADPRFIVNGRTAKLIADALLCHIPGTTAICAGSDAVAVDLIAELNRRGVRVPQDISVLGFDNDQRLPVSTPPLTTVDYDEFEIGYWAVRVLLEQSNGTGVRRLQVVLHTKLVERGSCAIPRTADHPLAVDRSAKDPFRESATPGIAPVRRSAKS